MIAGNLVDVAFPDLLQLLHMSGRSGTLYFERGAEQAFISFHHGRIASAWCPTSISVARVLEERGHVSSVELAKARARASRSALPRGTASRRRRRGNRCAR